MTLISRYVFRQAAGTLTLILLSLAGVVWIALALKQLNVVTSRGSDVWTLIALTTLALPNLLALIAPVALLIATIHVLNRLNGDSELIVLSAAGSTVWRIARPLIALALIVATGVAFVNHVAMPWTLRKLRTTAMEMHSNLLSQVLQPGRFTAAEGGKIVFHIRERRHDGELAGILMHDTRDPKQTMSYLAERGIVVQRNDETFLYMERGHVLRRTDKNPAPEILEFDNYAVDLDSFERKAGPPVWRPRELYTPELIAAARAAAAGTPVSASVPRPAAASPDAALAARIAARGRGQIYAELHERLSNPLYPLVFVLVALAFLGNSQSTRTNRLQTTVICFLVAATGRLAGMALNNLVVAKPALYPLMYVVPAVAMLAVLVALVISERPWLRGGLRGGRRSGRRFGRGPRALRAGILAPTGNRGEAPT
ncbi:MAG: LPS export ABC transporter permease LptF [Hyphomicrobiaceae bacterium]